MVGAHVGPDRPLNAAADIGADCVQIFLSDPQGWEKPPPRDDAAQLRSSDACHAHAAGAELSDGVGRVPAFVGRIDLLHANDSRDPPGTGADRHANLGQGKIGPKTLSAMIGSAGPPAVVETPGGVDELRADIEFVRAALAG